MSRSVIRAVVTSGREHVAQATTKRRAAVSGMGRLGGMAGTVGVRRAGRVCADQPPRRRGAAPEFASRCASRQLPGEHALQPTRVNFEWTATEPYTGILGSFDSGANTLDDQLS